MDMHRYSQETEALAQSMMRIALDRLRMDAPLDGPVDAQELWRRAGQTITPSGLGGEQALRVWTDVLAPATMSVDHPRYLAFIPGAPTEAATLFDLVLSVSSLYGGSWLESSGAVYAENQALRWIADLVGHAGRGRRLLRAGRHGRQPVGAGGGAARACASASAPHCRRGCGRRSPTETHSSVVYALRDVMDVDPLLVQADERGRMTGPALREALVREGADGVFAAVATSGTTNLGVVDDLAGIAEVCREYGLWFHVDGAYGGAALAAPSVRHLFAGIEHADSFIVDPHKWLFGPFDCCALVYRDPEVARRAHTQHAGYLDPINDAGEWNPSDYGVHLSRRARGLPFWFSLAMHGSDSYRDAIESTLQVARARRRRDPQPPVPGAAGRARPDRAHLPAGSAGRPRTTPPGRSGCSTRDTRSSPPRRTAASPARGLRSSTRAPRCPT